MSERYFITAETKVDEMTQRYPATAVLLMKTGVQCVGCWISRYHTVADVAKEWNLNLGRLLRHLNEFIEEENSPDGQ
jgi:hybrid cluster-associated redox disulfide protein